MLRQTEEEAADEKGQAGEAADVPILEQQAR